MGTPGLSMRLGQKPDRTVHECSGLDVRSGNLSWVRLTDTPQVEVEALICLSNYLETRSN